VRTVYQYFNTSLPGVIGGQKVPSANKETFTTCDPGSRATLAEVQAAARSADVLAVRDAAIGLANTTKCVGTGALSMDDVEAIVRMGAAVAGGEDKLFELISTLAAREKPAG